MKTEELSKKDKKKSTVEFLRRTIEKIEKDEFSGVIATSNNKSKDISWDNCGSRLDDAISILVMAKRQCDIAYKRMLENADYRQE